MGKKKRKFINRVINFTPESYKMLTEMAEEDDRNRTSFIRWLIAQEAKRRAAQRKEERSND